MNAYSDSLWEKNPEWMTPYNWDGEPFKEIKCLSTNPCIVKFVMNEYALDLQNPEDLENLKKQGWYKINADKQREIKRMLYNMKKISLKELDQRDIDLFNNLQKESKKDEN